MKCPVCGKEMEKGKIETRNPKDLTNSLTTVIWYDAENADKKIFRHGIDLQVDGVGYYCDTCMKAIAVFDER